MGQVGGQTCGCVRHTLQPVAVTENSLFPLCFNDF